MYGRGSSLKTLLILKCNDPHKWYDDKVGQTVPYLATEEIEYKSIEPAGYVNFVSLEDAEIVNG